MPTQKHVFAPDYAIPPGATLAETLESIGMPQSDLSLRTGLAEKTISQIINGIAPITPETALKLESVLGTPASFWNNLETNYRELRARIEEEKRLATEGDWLRTIPVKALIERDFVEPEADKGKLLKAVLAFFGVSDVAAWRRVWKEPAAVYRKSKVFKAEPELVATWLRMGQVLAAEMECQPYDVEKFRSALRQIRRLTNESADVFVPKVQRLCTEAGVAVVFVKDLKGAPLSGATMWLSKDKAMIALSLRYKNDAALWFTFFHESAHVLLHGKKDVFIEDDRDGDDEKELEADRFARDGLIPRHRASELPSLKSRAAIKAFAHSVGIAPGIVVGRLQHDGLLDPSFCNGLKRKLEWGE